MSNQSSSTTPIRGNDWLTISEAAAYLGSHPNTIRQMIARGDFPAYRFSERLVRVKRSDIDRAGHRVESLAIG